MADKPVYVPFYEDMFDMMDDLSDEDLRKALAMVRAYVFDGVEPEESGAARLFFRGCRRSIDASLALRRKNKENRTKANQTEPDATKANETEPDATKPNQTEPDETKPNQTEPDETKRNQTEPDATKTDIEQRTKNKEQRPKSKEQTKTGGRSRGPAPVSRDPPSADEVQRYGDEVYRRNGLSPALFDAEAFIAYYGSQGWRKSNGQPVTNWKGCVVTWMKRNKPEVSTVVNARGDEVDWGRYDKPASPLPSGFGRDGEGGGQPTLPGS